MAFWFGSAVNAVQCAVDLQQRMADANADQPDDSPIALRIGVNLGDVIVQGADPYGHGVNIAARLEAMAEPGGICLSGSVYDQVKRKLAAVFEHIGLQTFKNAEEPVPVYRMNVVMPGKQEHDKTGRAIIPLPKKPSIAILPFTNMSSDLEYEYFADVLTEDLITIFR
jgi:class 3 adenylate cyclase